ncbi:MAG: hypothetical protein A2749_02585 [Parcubacteria group bacterium RIFCSPHIGHO2_01_FULL_45_26]|nr:MAG: hypothetical protein A2749_02585 [Parcubacteria group bacterium RIFCSPHIGHO2_01_FULL_45_26]
MVEDSYASTEELLKLTRENNVILRGMRRAQRWHTFFQIIYWLAAAGVVVASYRYVQPYLDSLLATYASVQKTIGGIPKF